MKLTKVIEQHVLTDPEWRQAYEEAELRRQSARMLARARREQGISQAELAERCGTAQAVISRIERGVFSPSLDTLSRVAAGLGMRPVINFEPVPEKTLASGVIPKGSSKAAAAGTPRPGKATPTKAAKPKPPRGPQHR